MMLALVLLIAAAVPARAAESPTIVITGTPIADLKSAHDQCLERGCPPRADIAATLAYAEALFVAGDYKRARSILFYAIRRNNRFAGPEPDAVSQLYRASSRVSLHLGNADSFRLDSHRMVRALKAGAVRDEAEILLSEIEVADMRLRLGEPRMAEWTLESIERRASAAGLPQISAIVQLRRAWMPYFIRQDRRATTARLKAVAELPGDDLGPIRLAARVLMVRLSATKRPPDIGPLISSTDGLPTRQMLLWTPPFDLPRVSSLGARLNRTMAEKVANQGFNNRWADIGFRLRRDGTVDDVTVLRSSGSEGWLPVAVRQVAGRRYSPLPAVDAVTDDTGDYRIERHTYTSFFQPRKGTRVLGRDGIPRIEVLDLTPVRPMAGVAL